MQISAKNGRGFPGYPRKNSPFLHISAVLLKYMHVRVHILRVILKFMHTDPGMKQGSPHHSAFTSPPSTRMVCPVI